MKYFKLFFLFILISHLHDLVNAMNCAAYYDLNNNFINEQKCRSCCGTCFNRHCCASDFDVYLDQNYCTNFHSSSFIQTVYIVYIVISVILIILLVIGVAVFLRKFHQRRRHARRHLNNRMTVAQNSSICTIYTNVNGRTTPPPAYSAIYPTTSDSINNAQVTNNEDSQKY